MEEYSYTSIDPLGHTGPVTGSLYLLGILSVASPSQVCASVRCVFVTECMKYTELVVDSSVDFIPDYLNIDWLLLLLKWGCREATIWCRNPVRHKGNVRFLSRILVSKKGFLCTVSECRNYAHDFTNFSHDIPTFRKEFRTFVFIVFLLQVAWKIAVVVPTQKIRSVQLAYFLGACQEKVSGRNVAGKHSKPDVTDSTLPCFETVESYYQHKNFYVKNWKYTILL